MEGNDHSSGPEPDFFIGDPAAEQALDATLAPFPPAVEELEEVVPLDAVFQQDRLCKDTSLPPAEAKERDEQAPLPQEKFEAVPAIGVVAIAGESTAPKVPEPLPDIPGAAEPMATEAPKSTGQEATPLAAGDPARFRESKEAEEQFPEVRILQEAWEAEAANPQEILAVERRQVGDVEVRGILCTHTLANAGEILTALESCEWVGLEGYPAGQDDADRADVEARLSDAPAEQSQDLLLEGLASDIRNNRFNSVMLHYLREDGRKIHLIDATLKDLPEPDSENHDNITKEFQRGIRDLVPLDKMRKLGERELASAAEFDRVREEVMSWQIKRLVENAHRENHPVTIGIVLGGIHQDLITGLGTPVDPEASQQNKEKLKAASRMVADMEDPASVRAAVDRRLLVGLATSVGANMRLGSGVKNHLDRMRRTVRLFNAVGQLDDEQVDGYMCSLQQPLDESWRTKGLPDAQGVYLVLEPLIHQAEAAM